MSEVDPDNVREEAFGSATEGFGAGVVSEGEVGTDVGEHGTEEVMGELAAGEGDEGEVMRGIGEDGRGEKGKAGDLRG